MSDEKTIQVALLLSKDDEDGLTAKLGLRDKEIEQEIDPAKRRQLEDDPNLQISPGTHMGFKDEAKKIGLRVLKRWSTGLQSLVCNPKTPEDRELANSIQHAVTADGGSLEVVLIGFTVTALLAINAPAAIAAVAAPLLVKKIIIPAKDELCVAWDEYNRG